MKKPIHPIVTNFKKEVSHRELTYKQLASMAQISESKLKKLFSGRADMTLDDYDKLRTALDVGDMLEITPEIRIAFYALIRAINESSPMKE
ncbi:helix-turn-helix transcriptional regulator [Vibrio cholerae]|nr:helix-turn-helix transcriptional regulator [Vibrio cholerae]